MQLWNNVCAKCKPWWNRQDYYEGNWIVSSSSDVKKTNMIGLGRKTGERTRYVSLKHDRSISRVTHAWLRVVRSSRPTTSLTFPRFLLIFMVLTCSMDFDCVPENRRLSNDEINRFHFSRYELSIFTCFLHSFHHIRIFTSVISRIL